MPLAAQEQAAKPPASPDDNEVVVRGERGDRSAIDRETYVVKDTPLAQARSGTEVIQNLPSVSIDASGQLRLLGSSNVQILIDGRAVPNANARLASLQASQIARIEVMTNPSAQFSSYGSAGIINIVLRRTFRDGLGGSAVLGAGYPGYLTGKLSPTWSKGAWSISASPSVTLSDSASRSSLERSGVGADPILNRRENARGGGTLRSVAGTVLVGFKPSEGKSYNLTTALGRSSYAGNDERFISSPVPIAPSFVELSSTDILFEHQQISLERKVTGRRAGEEFTASFSWDHSTISSRYGYLDVIGSDTRRFAVGNASDSRSASIKLDYILPVGKKDTLSAGAAIERQSDRAADSANGALVTGPVDARSAFAGHSLDATAYVTFQTALGSLKILPGLRVQHRRFSFDQASSVAPMARTLLFPSLHLERAFGKLITTFSVSRRADWPSISQFSPYRVISDPSASAMGNAALRPEETLAFEAGGKLSIAGQQMALKVYRRRRTNPVTTVISVADDGTLLSTRVNVGDRVTQGGQLSIQGKFSRALRYSISGWLGDASFEQIEGAARVRVATREYGGNGQLEFSRGKQGETGFQQLTLNLRVDGPFEYPPIRLSASYAGDFTYTRNLSRRVAVVAALNQLIGSRTTVTHTEAALFDQRAVRRLDGPQLRLSLTYKLGK